MKARRPFALLLMAAGSLVSISFFIWPTVAITYPLVIAELFVLVHQQYLMRQSVAEAVRSAMAFGIGGLATIGVLLIPIWHLLGKVATDIPPILMASQPPHIFRDQIENLLNSFKQSLLLPISILIGLVYGRGNALRWATIIAVAYLCSTWVYVNRLIYLLPYAIALIAGAYQIPRGLNAKRPAVMAHAALAALLCISVTMSLIARPAIALSQKVNRDPAMLFELGRDSIGSGPRRIYVGAWEFYFPGRELGWQMFNEYVDSNQTRFSKLLESMDYAIFRADNVSAELDDQLRNAGLLVQTTIDGKRQPSFELMRLTNFGAKPYGPYVLYGRKASSE
jgi:hypothetical protein